MPRTKQPLVEPRHGIDERPFMRHASLTALKSLYRAIVPPPKEDIVTWVERHIDLSYDLTSSATGPVKLRPYQIDPLRATEQPGVRQVTLAWSQRMGKSSIWKFSLVKRIADGALSGLITFPSDMEVKRALRDTVRPLLERVPGVARDWAVRGNVTDAGIHLPSQQSVLYWQGGRQQAISLTCSWVAMDEVDYHRLYNADEEGRNFDNIRALRLRMQTFKERMMILCSSVTTATAPIYREWKAGSREVWNMRCLACGGYLPTNKLAFHHEDGNGNVDWRGLQWEKDDAGEIMPDSIRYVCPHCGHEHHQEDASAMNAAGRYIAEQPHVTAHRSFLAGALASPDWTWLEIAQAQEDAIDTDGKKFLNNAILSMPYVHRRETSTQSLEELNRTRQIDYPSDLEATLVVITAGIDVQKSELAGKKYYVYAVRGWRNDGTSFQLAIGIANSLDELESVLQTTYYGHKVQLAIFDHGGFDNSQDLTPFIQSHGNYYYYKGTSAKNIPGNGDWAKSKEHKIFLAAAVAYQVKLLDLLYSPPRPTGYRWYMLKDCPEEMFRQICSVRPNNRMKYENGQAYANWESQDRRDAFDAEKMALCACDIACALLPAQAFRQGRKPAFYVKEQIRKLKWQKHK